MTNFQDDVEQLHMLTAHAKESVAFKLIQEAFPDDNVTNNDFIIRLDKI